MLEKIKINMTDFMYQTIKLDAFRFNFKNNDLNINYNQYLNTVIKNYYPLYKKYKNTYPELFRNNEFHNIVTSFVLKDYIDNTNTLSQYITIRPNKETQNTFLEIELNEIKNISLSSFVRNLLEEFNSLKLYEKEKILFHKNYELIINNIKKKKLFIKTDRSEFIFDCYSIKQSPNDEHNYLLGKMEFSSTSQIGCIKLCTISTVIETEEKSNISNDDICKIKSAEEKSIQFINNELIHSFVKFTPGGIKMYDKCYNDRPNYINFDKENLVMEFENTMDHLFFYLKQFGRHAIVLEPKELSEKLYDFHKKAINGSD